MTTSPKERATGAGGSRIRPGVWLLVLGLGLIMLAVILLPRPAAVQVPEEPVQPPRVVAGDKSSPVRVDLSSMRSRQAVPESEPVQKTVDGWILDLGSTNWQVVSAALNAFRRLGSEATPAIPQLAQMVKEGRSRNAATRALAMIGTNGLPVLIEALSSENAAVRLEAAGALGWNREANEPAVPALVECIRDKDSGARLNAIAALQLIARRADIAVPGLIEALADPEVHESAGRTLQKYAEVQADTTIPMLIEAAKEERNPVAVRFRAGEIVRAIAPERAKAEGL